MNINSVKPAIYFGEKLINRVDAVIPRIGASVTSYGTAVVRQLEMMNCYCFNSANAILNSRDKLKSLKSNKQCHYLAFSIYFKFYCFSMGTSYGLIVITYHIDRLPFDF